MIIYLTIITTVLVLTQVIRVTQNAMQLKMLTKKNSELSENIKAIAEKYLKEA